MGDRLPWIRLSVVSLLFILHLAVTVFVTQPGHLSIDEGIYHQMARAFAQSGSLSVWNGYEEFPSDELKHPIHAVRDGALYPQYPYLTAIAAWPFYTAMGYRGLFVMNALAYVAVALLCFATTRRIFGDARLALDSVVILTLASYAWQYSQEAWPHTLSLMFIAAAVYCTVRGLSRDSSGSGAHWAFVAGTALGIGAGARLDVVFALPAIVLPYLFLTPMRPRAALTALAGLIPGLAALAATNYVKFGVPSPFSYGGAKAGAGELIHYLPVLAYGLLATIGLWAVTRPGIRIWLRARPAGVAVATAVALIGLWLVPPVAAATQQLGAGAVRLIVDFRLYDAARIEPGMSLTAGGSVVYFSGLKKALLQSMPWLPLLALPVAAFARANQPHRVLGMLFILATAYLAFYSYYAWHGGLALNLRYFLPVLLPSAILGAWALRELAREAPPAMLVPAIIAAPTAFLVATYLVYRNLEPAAAEGPLLTVPLVFAVLLAILLLCRAVATGPARRATAGVAVLCAATAMGWGSASTIAYDAPMSAALRALHAERARVVVPYLTADSILFVYHETPYYGLYELDRVRIAATNRDDFDSFRPLLEHHLAAGRPVYLALGEKGMAIARERGLLEGLRLNALSEQVSRVDAAAPDFQQIPGEPQ
ncbi:MAG: glycosyltransferase family 39 protein [Alphaproteobacteria bacterium]|nr:glycosyltransferase family 39 protein [Alphaproteobacteria bacterium]